MLHMRMINLTFAIIIALGVVYNGARISLSERSRELATLRVIGFTRREISTILLGEIGTITLLGVPFGLVMGYWFAWMLTLFLDQEVFRFPFVISNSTYGLAAGTVLAASIGSALLVRRKLDDLDLIAVLEIARVMHRSKIEPQRTQRARRKAKCRIQDTECIRRALFVFVPFVSFVVN